MYFYSNIIHNVFLLFITLKRADFSKKQPTNKSTFFEMKKEDTFGYFLMMNIHTYIYIVYYLPS